MVASGKTRAPRAPVPSLHHHLGQSILPSCDRTGARSIVQVRGSQRRGQCHGHRVLVLARARAWPRGCATASAVLALARPSPLPHSGAQHDAFLLEPRRARVPPAGRTRVLLHPGKRHHSIDAPMPRRLARKCLQGRKRRSPCARIGRHGMVAAFGKAATAALAPSATIMQNAGCARRGASLCFLSRPGPSARLGRLSPRRVLPPWTPQPGYLPGARSLRELAK